MKTDPKPKYYYTLLDKITGVIELFASRLSLSEAYNIPYHKLNYRFGRLGLKRYKVSEQYEVQMLESVQ